MQNRVTQLINALMKGIIRLPLNLFPPKGSKIQSHVEGLSSRVTRPKKGQGLRYVSNV